MAAEEPFPETSDLDLAVVVPVLDPERHRVRKSAYAGLVVEPFYFPSERFGSTRADMALVGMGTVAEARSRVQACRLALQGMTDVSDDIVSRNPRAFA